MSLREALDKYREADCYGPFCSNKSCGLFSNCQQSKSNDNFWYPDCIKDKYIRHTDRRGIKTCDILTCTDIGIYLAELKPIHGTDDVINKIQGTHKLLTIIYPEFDEKDLRMMRCFLVSCDNGCDPNKHFKMTISFLSQKNMTSSLYTNGIVEINNVEIPIFYHRTCADFIQEGLANHFL